ncbi:uncharacterized protein LOC144547179 [Carex rostrata]
MPDSFQLKFDVKVVKLANFIGKGSDEKLFIRYYIPAFGDRRIQVDTKEFQPSNNVSWNECASFVCHVNSDQIGQLDSSRITFELRSKTTRQIFGGTRSKLLGGGEILWKDVLESKGMQLEKWVKFSQKSGKLDGLKLPNLLVEMKAQVTRDAILHGIKRRCGSDKVCDWAGSEVDMFSVETLID